MRIIPLHKSQWNLRPSTPTVQNCVCSKLLFWLKSNIEEPLTNQILKKKVNEPLKTIFYLPHYASLLSKANFKIDHVHCSKLCLLKCIIFCEKSMFAFRLLNLWRQLEKKLLNKKNDFNPSQEVGGDLPLVTVPPPSVSL